VIWSTADDTGRGQSTPMFRRIEFIHPGGVDEDDQPFAPWKEGLMSVVTGPIPEAWAYDLTGPSRSDLPSNSRFYFAEKGWKEIGRKVTAAAWQTNQAYRVIAIKETDAQVVWRDKARGYEVAVQPSSKRRSP
jgi:hypothetical protein